MAVPVDVVTPPPAGAQPAPLPLAGLATLLAVLIAGWWAGRVAVLENHHEDLWIYTSAARMAFHGTSPYDTDRIHAAVAAQYDDEDFVNNSGFMYPPAALLVFGPFALPGWTAAKAAWCGLMIVLAAAAAWNLSAFTAANLPPWFTAAAVVVTLCNPLSLFVLIVGQTPLLFVGCVVLGQAAHRRGRARLGALLWAVACVKPHIAIPLLPLAWLLGGWKRAAEVLLYAGLMNVIAGAVTVGNPLFVLDYLAYIPQGHQSVEFNRVAVSRQITGWNRLLVACGGPAVELGLVGTLVGYVVWFGLAWVRALASRRGGQTNHAWWLAVAALGALLCCQSQPYELPLLVLLLPYLGELFVSGRARDQAVALVIAGLATFAMLPGGEDSMAVNVANAVGGVVDRVGEWVGVPWNVTWVLVSHRSVGVFALAVTVLARGGVRRKTPLPTDPRSADAHFLASGLAYTPR